MGEFIDKSIVKSAVRKLTTPIALSAAYGVIMKARGSNLWKAQESTIVKQGYTSIYHYKGGERPTGTHSGHSGPVNRIITPSPA